ncbi:MAG: hypothetical protein COU45_05395 [Nitrosopumilus sp. CG10_big_fil_rev_8_21_14_0_10_33_7]|nr:MAG: hypothetical protein COU45_05395 [Nitrosopumilus sp. CG10_big_fil_rev_8_21_14_0_10_33_7]
MPLLSPLIFAGILLISILQFANVRKNMQIQSEQQIYTKVIEARLKLENTDTFSNMAIQSPIFAKRFSVVDTPEEYYISVAFLDIFEFMFRLHKTKTIDPLLWQRWNKLIQMFLTIPKFKKIWDETKQSHTAEFIEFFDSLQDLGKNS